MDRVGALSACKALLEQAVPVENGVAGASGGIELTIRFVDDGWEISTVIRTHAHAFLVLADPQKGHVGYRWFDGRSYSTTSTPPELLDTVLKATHSPSDDRLVDRWERLALVRLEAKDDVLAAKFGYHYYGLDRELLQDGINAMSALRAALASAIGGLPEEEVSLPSGTAGPYRSATMRTTSHHGPSAAYEKAAQKIERKVREERLVRRTPFIVWMAFYFVLALVAIWSDCK